MLNDLQDCYRVLELEPGATLEDVKRSYRELVKVWHPDRFANDPRLQKKAQEKLKEINLAYERICKGEAAEPRRRPSSAGAGAPHAEEQARAAGDTSSPGSRSGPQREEPRQSPPPRPQAAPRPKTNWGRRFVQFAVTVVIIAVVKGVFSTGDRSRRQTRDYAPPHTQPSQSYQAAQPAVLKPQPKNRQRLSVGQIVELHREALKRRPDLQMSVQEFSRFMQANQSDYDFSEGIAYSPPTPVWKQPTAAGASERFAQEAVAAPNTRLEDTKRVEVAPVRTHDPIAAAPSSPNPGFFTVGSTKDEVLAVQGEPHKFTDSTFAYGASQVRFKDGKVESWSDTGYSKLKAKLLPAGQVEARDYFTVGSSKDEVLAVQGTPDNFSDSTFTYGASQVRFKDGKVESWSDTGYSRLKTKFLPPNQVEIRDYFTLGSTRDEVLAIQGTPDRISRGEFAYGTSTVQLKDGRWFHGAKATPSSRHKWSRPLGSPPRITLR